MEEEEEVVGWIEEVTTEKGNEEKRYSREGTSNPISHGKEPTKKNICLHNKIKQKYGISFVNYVSSMILLESRGIAIASIKGHDDDQNGLFAGEDDPCSCQCRTESQDSQANLSSKEKVLGFQRWVLLELGCGSLHWKILRRKVIEENRVKKNRGELRRNQNKVTY